jgi:hypothetical protein
MRIKRDSEQLRHGRGRRHLDRAIAKFRSDASREDIRALPILIFSPARVSARFSGVASFSYVRLKDLAVPSCVSGKLSLR